MFWYNRFNIILRPRPFNRSSPQFAIPNWTINMTISNQISHTFHINSEFQDIVHYATRPSKLTVPANTKQSPI